MSRAGATTGRLALVGDIGGTNARFGLVDLQDDRLEVVAAKGYLCSAFPNAPEAITAYLAEQGLTCALSGVAIAVAGPIEAGAIRFTNSNWHLSENRLREMGFGSACLLNDYAALAIAAPLLQGKDLQTIGPDLDAPGDQTIAVVGPGTGFGVSALARDGSGVAILATEGGHIAFAPGDDVEIEILRLLAARYGRVSVERILSGPGLRDLHQCLRTMAGRPSMVVESAEITRQALAGDPDCLATVERFCAILGAVAGDFALSFGARGGIYLAGGIPPLIIDVLRGDTFRRRFEDKGRFAGYLAAIPTRVIMRPHAALVGAAHALLNDDSNG